MTVVRPHRSAKASAVRWVCREFPLHAGDVLRRRQMRDPCRGSDSAAPTPGECFSDLARNPFRHWATRHTYPDEFSASEPHDYKSIEQAEREGWYNEQVHRRNVRRMVAEKRPQALAPRSTAPDHVLGELIGRLQSRASAVRRECAAHPRAGCQRSSRGSAPVEPRRSAAALPFPETSIANSCETQLDASGPVSLAG